MKKLKLLCASLLFSALAFSQSNSIDSIPSTSAAIELPPAEHWRVVLPGELFNRATFHLVRAEGCWMELSESNAETEALKKQINQLDAKILFLQKADEISERIQKNVDKMIERTKWQTFWGKVAQWFKDRTKELVAFILGLIAAGEAVYIIYLTVGL